LELKALLNGITILEEKSGPASKIKGLAYHSDRVEEGFLFICLKGYKTDGHLYLEQAREKGAAAAIVEDIRENLDIPQYRVADTRATLAELADRFYGHPSSKIHVTGVTATNGKTSTTYMLNAILEKQGLNTGLIGTVIVKTGPVIRPAELTTPESLDLHRIFHQMVEEKVSHAVMEVSSSGLELNRVGHIDFDTVVLNNISREHIDLHGSFEAYFKAKAGLIRNAKKGGWAILNLDCPYSASLKNETAARVFTYGLKNRDADCLVNDLDLSTGRARFKVKILKQEPVDIFAGYPDSFQVELSVLGLHSVYNAMAAILAALLQGIPTTVIQKALKDFGGVERRFELIFEDDIKIIDDHFANYGNINVTLETLQMMDYNNLHLVYAIRGGRGVTVNRENAEAIAEWAPRLGLDQVIATTSVSHVDEKDVVSEQERIVFEEVMKKAGLEVEIYEELPDAIARGLAKAAADDVVLLAGCQGMDYGASVCLEQIHRQRPHLDKEKVFAALKNRVAGV